MVARHFGCVLNRFLDKVECELGVGNMPIGCVLNRFLDKVE